MRPPRLFILALFSIASLFLLCRAISSLNAPAPTISPPRSSRRSAFRSFFSFDTPFTLFPPNAIITIADDNSTSFAARPAAFGPPLPGRGLNGELWVGGSFAEDIIVEGEGDGELGCSDVPGWNDGSSISALKPAIKEVQDTSNSAAGSLQAKKPKQDDVKSPLVVRSALYDSDAKRRNQKTVDDGTDDYLHQRLDKSQRLTSESFASSSSNHADIQSIQEGAEITGKIVLLSRGGCGFLEKVKWAQRRGATGLIVGDNKRGGPLIQMYAHGDTSNVTIPSIFTSRTTAYLLSLMMQPGSYAEEGIDEAGKSTSKAQSSDKSVGKGKRSASTSSLRSEGAEQLRESYSTVLENASVKPGWFSRLLGLSPRKKTLSDSDRSTGSSKSDWVLVEDFSDEKDAALKKKLKQAVKSGLNGDSNSQLKTPSSIKDDFRIGVEDWRDPDLIGVDRLSNLDQGSGTHPKTDKSASAKKQGQKAPSRGATNPNTGEYAANHMPSKGHDAIGNSRGKSSTTSSESSGLISKIFGSTQDGAVSDEVGTEDIPSVVDAPFIGRPGGIGEPPPASERDGLWVVVTPTSGASPFFDTLLVLVISPLITLTVVYALLLLRARIRRRRWRAPKSVVERLPVRTYHTVTSTPSRTPRLPTPTSSSPTTPLLQNQHGPSRPRPRSRTTTGVPSGDDLLDVNAALAMPVGPREHEKRPGASQWKKYMGRQVECVVCLEEYVDGVSQVMSLPCGHEFHVDCITPWLTTRRRTCPICKGDVVRSLARGSPSSPRYEPYQDDSDEDEMTLRAAGSASSSSNHEVDNSDLEQGIPDTGHTSQPGWFSVLSDNVRERLFPRFDRTPSGSENRDR